MSRLNSIFILLLFSLSAVQAQKTVSEQRMREIYEEVKTPYKYGMVLAPEHNQYKIDCPTVFRENGKWYMSYLIYNGKGGRDGRGYETWLAESDDLLEWKTLGRILSFPTADRWDLNQRAGYIALVDYEWGGSYRAQSFKGKSWMSYFGGRGKGYEQGMLKEGIAYTEGDITTAHEWKTLDKPILSPEDKKAGWWENITQYKSSVIWDKKKTLGAPFVMYYNAGGVNPANQVKAERIGIALSHDMVNWKRYKGNPIVNHEQGITGDGVIQQIGDTYVMFYFGAFHKNRPYQGFNTFACSYDLIHWTDWAGDDLIIPSESYDNLFAHKSCVVKWNGVVYHFYCAVNHDDQRGIAVATSSDLGKSLLDFPEPDRSAFRKEFSLNKDWLSVAHDTDKEAYQGFEQVEYQPEGWEKVQVPHNWDTYHGARRMKHGNRHGTAWYRKNFEAIDYGQGKRYSLFFEGVGSYATVYLNGKEVGSHAGGRTTFTLDVTGQIRFDRPNVLAVKAEHPPMITDLPWVCGGCSSEWGFSEGSQPMGIFRPVTLVVSHDVRIEPFGVHAWNTAPKDEKNPSFLLYTNTEVKNYSQATRTVEVIQKLVDKNGNQVERLTDTLVLRAGEVREIKQVSAREIERPQLWSPESPYLYQLITMIKENGKEVDRETTAYGFRWIKWPIYRTDGEQRFFLNGKPVFVNGVCEYEHLLGQSHAFSREQVMARVKEIKAAGFNAFRDAHQPHNLLYQEQWDKQGILFWTQLSAHIWYDTPEFRANFKKNLREWVKERRSCPSVVLWGLQNESTLPKAFAEECRQIIREMDPTSPDQRLVTTCNGGEGTDWNVVQNWSGTYGGDPYAYDKELSRQLLNGEYGAWRSIDLHTEGEFDQKGVWSEDRMSLLMEMKIRQAESAKDSLCGQFFWIFNSHDNPGRIQNDEGFREIDRIGPFNYKGLLTPWEEPLDVYYLYRANYAPKETEPMVYIVSHTWTNRWLEAGRKDGIRVFSNCDEVELFNDVRSLSFGRKKNPGRGAHFRWDGVDVRHNLLYAVGYVDGKPVAEDYIVMDYLPRSPRFDELYGEVQNLTKAEPGYRYLYRLNCGGDTYVDSNGQTWLPDVHWKEAGAYGSLSWIDDLGNLPPFLASQRCTKDPVTNTRDEALFQTFRYGRDRLRFRFPLPDGEYRVELYFTEPWYGTGGGMDASGLRLFDVAISGTKVIRKLDIWREAGGHDKALKKVVRGKAVNGWLEVSFPEVAVSQAVVSAIAVATDRQDIRVETSPRAAVSQPDNGSLHHWLDTGKDFPLLPPALYGAQWIKPEEASRPICCTALEDIEVYVPTGQSAADTSFVKHIHRKGSVLNYTVSRPLAIQPLVDWKEEKNLRPEIKYEAEEAEQEGSSWKKGAHRKRDYVKVEENTEHRMVWTISPGLAGVYALRFHFMNVSGAPIEATIRILASDGRVMKEDTIHFHPAPEKWRMLSTTTGAYINAGHYRVEISGDKLKGLWLESLDMQ